MKGNTKFFILVYLNLVLFDKEFKEVSLILKCTKFIEKYVFCLG